MIIKRSFTATDFFSFLHKYGYYILFGLISQIISILLPPNPSISGSKEALCNYYISKFNIFNIHIDCDSQYFLLDSQDPSRLFSDAFPLQDKPLYTFVVYIISKALGFIGVPSGPITYLGEDGIPQTYNILNYGIFIFLNAIILIVSIVLALKVIQSSGLDKNIERKISIFLVLILISQNPVNREYFWTPTSQLFNILIPVLLFYMVQKEFTLDKKRFFYILFFISLSLLVYTTFLILLPIFFLKTLRYLGKFYSVLIVLSLVPKLIWPKVVTTLGGSYIDWPIVGHRRFIWISDSIKSGTLTGDSKSNFLDFLHSLPLQWVLITFAILFLGIKHLISQHKTHNRIKLQDFGYQAVALGTYTAGMILNGEYGPRFTTGVVLLLSLLVLKEVGFLAKTSKYSYIAYSGIVVANFWFWVVN